MLQGETSRSILLWVPQAPVMTEISFDVLNTLRVTRSFSVASSQPALEFIPILGDLSTHAGIYHISIK